jgi:diguanylate cyclase
MTAGIGLGAGWLLFGGLFQRGPFGSLGARRSREFLARLYQTVLSTAEEINAHGLKLEEVSQELAGVKDAESLTVLAAVSQVLDHNRQMRDRLHLAESRMREQAQLLELQARQVSTDPLTGLANRRAFDRELARRTAEFRRFGRIFSLLLIDVDHFKRCNDRYGHPAGDVVLRELAAVFSQQVRDIDLVTRYGGEEFAIVLPSTPIAGAVAAAERIRRTVEAAVFPGLERGLQVTISLGAAELGAALEPKQLIDQADAALYRAKDESAPVVSPSTAGDDASTPAEDGESSPDQALAIGDSWQFGDLPGRDALLAPLDAAILKWRYGGRPFAILLLHVNDLPTHIAAHGTKTVRRAIKRALGLARATFGEIRVLGQLDDATAAVFLCGVPLTQLSQSAGLLREALLQTAPTSLPSLSLSLSAAEVHWGDSASSLLARAEQSLKGALRLGGSELSLQTVAPVLAPDLPAPPAGVAQPSVDSP